LQPCSLRDVPIRAAYGSTSKALVGNAGYRRYLKTIRDEHFAIDPDKIEEDQEVRRHLSPVGGR